MKRFISVFAALCLALGLLSGCAPSIENTEEEISEAELLETDGEYLDAAGNVIALQDVTPDNWYKVRLTYPVDFVTEEQLETYIDAYEDVSVSDKNRVTVVMSKDQYHNLMESAEEAIQAEFDACMSGELDGVLPDIPRIESDELHEETCVYISGDFSRQQVTQLSFLLCREIYSYKALVGNNSETKVIILDNESGAVYGELTYRQVFEYLQKSGEEEAEG